LVSKAVGLRETIDYQVLALTACAMCASSDAKQSDVVVHWYSVYTAARADKSHYEQTAGCDLITVGRNCDMGLTIMGLT